MTDKKNKISLAYPLVAWILLVPMPIALPFILIIAITMIFVCLIITIPKAIIILTKDGVDFIIEYINFRKQRHKILKDFEKNKGINNG